MVEFHIDDCKSFGIQMNKTASFGGHLSSLFINAPKTVIDEWIKEGMFEHEICHPKLAMSTILYKVNQ